MHDTKTQYVPPSYEANDIVNVNRDRLLNNLRSDVTDNHGYPGDLDRYEADGGGTASRIEYSFSDGSTIDVFLHSEEGLTITASEPIYEDGEYVDNEWSDSVGFPAGMVGEADFALLMTADTD